jgi:hypothetical protein
LIRNCLKAKAPSVRKVWEGLVLDHRQRFKGVTGKAITYFAGELGVRELHGDVNASVCRIVGTVGARGGGTFATHTDTKETSVPLYSSTVVLPSFNVKRPGWPLMGDRRPMWESGLSQMVHLQVLAETVHARTCKSVKHTGRGRSFLWLRFKI